MENWLLGMTTVAEQQYLENYARSFYSGEGEIVDLGCWLGSTTIPVAKGLSESTLQNANRKRIHAYDQFRWEDYMSDCVRRTDLEGKFTQGDSFLNEFLQRIEPWLAYVDVQAADLQTVQWQGGPIEFLIIDAMKSWELATAIIQTFFPALIAGKSYVFQQDYAHYYTSWIHLIQYRFRENLQLIYAIPGSYGFVFQYVKPFPEELLKQNYDPTLFSEAEVEEAFRYSMHLSDHPLTRSNIASARVMWHLHQNDPEKAKFHFDKYILEGLPLEGDLKIVGKMLHNTQY